MADNVINVKIDKNWLDKIKEKIGSPDDGDKDTLVKIISLAEIALNNMEKDGVIHIVNNNKTVKIPVKKE